jgi:uncharacterized membrane protein YwzB
MDVWMVLAVWVIVLAFAALVSARINLRSEDPRATGTRLVSVVVVLALMTAAWAVVGVLGAAVVLVLAIAAEAVHVVRRRRRAT